MEITINNKILTIKRFIMKKLLYSIATLAILCFAAGCQREVDIDPVKGELVETEFVVTLDDATVTKAAINNNAANIDKLYIAAFKTSDGSYLSEISEENENFVIPKPLTQDRLEEILLEFGLMDL